MIRSRFTAVAASAVIAAAVVAAGLTPASAETLTYDTDFVPTSTDIVGTGSDTTQIVVHDLAVAFNKGKTSGRIATFQAPTVQTDPGTIVLRSGLSPITRPDGSGQGKALLFGSTNNADADFARSSATLNSTEIAGGLVQFPFAIDGLKMAVDATSTNAPATVSPADLYKIYTGVYTNWNQVEGSTKSGVIKALIPQSGSGTRKYFEAQLLAAVGSTATSITNLGSDVKITQEHSDADIKNDPNAIAPFSTARAASDKTIKLIGGLDVTRPIYNVVRQTDLSGTRGALLKSAFGADGFFCGVEGRKVIEGDGFKQIAPGICGVQTTAAVSATPGTAVNTKTSLAASAVGQSVTLKATVKPATAAAISGIVEFFDGTTSLGKAGASASGTTTVTKSLTNVKAGAHTYSAVFTPAVVTLNGSTSSALKVTVKYSSTTSLAIKGSTATVKVAIPNAKGTTASGTVTVYNGSKAVAKGTLKKGAASIKLSLKKGSYKLVAKYPGSSTVAGSASKTVAYKVK